MSATSDNKTDWIGAQAQLLTNSCLREAFRKDSGKVAVQLNILPSERSLFVGLSPDQLDAQATALLDKRLHEVHGIMPKTYRALGVKARPFFLSYAATFWPEGHQRHLVDAIHFARYLQSCDVKELCVAELNWLQIALKPTRLRIRLARHRMSAGRACPSLQILTSYRGRLRQDILYLALPWGRPS